MKSYVAGFLFAGDCVALVNNTTLKAIDGKIEDGETSIDAMTRKFKEETTIGIFAWTEFLILEGSDWIIHFFFSEIDSPIPIFGLNIGWYKTDHLKGTTTPNLEYLIPLAKAHNLELPIFIKEKS